MEEETRRYRPTKNYLSYLPAHDYSAFEVSWGGLAVPAPSTVPPRTPLVPYPCPGYDRPCLSPSSPPYPLVSPHSPACPSPLPSPQTEIMRNEFERLAARQPLELLSMKR